MYSLERAPTCTHLTPDKTNGKVESGLLRAQNVHCGYTVKTQVVFADNKDFADDKRQSAGRRCKAIVGGRNLSFRLQQQISVSCCKVHISFVVLNIIMSCIISSYFATAKAGRQF